VFFGQAKKKKKINEKPASGGWSYRQEGKNDLLCGRGGGEKHTPPEESAACADRNLASNCNRAEHEKQRVKNIFGGENMG